MGRWCLLFILSRRGFSTLYTSISFTMSLLDAFLQRRVRRTFAALKPLPFSSIIFTVLPGNFWSLRGLQMQIHSQKFNVMEAVTLFELSNQPPAGLEAELGAITTRGFDHVLVNMHCLCMNHRYTQRHFFLVAILNSHTFSIFSTCGS